MSTIQTTENNNESEPPKKKMKISHPRTFELTPVEKEMFEDLRAVAISCGSIIRVAGGWVRDKIMGRQSEDIDIAIDNMMGKEFAENVNKYMKDHQKKQAKVGVIKLNPDQSKHLETACMHLFGLSIDFVNLRSESYSEDSRIPSTMGMGTAEEDAYRRDLTINALFYNINDESVEDFTGKGLEDIKEKLIRTPLPPFTTFIDDPLRVLRSIRFASRYNFKLDIELIKAAQDPRVTTALREKIAKERIGKEFNGMISDPSPGKALDYLRQLNLWDILFATPIRFDHHHSSILGAIKLVYKYNTYTSDVFVKLSKDQYRISTLALIMMIYYEQQYPNPKKKTQLIRFPYFIICESLKLPNKDADDVNTILSGKIILEDLIQSGDFSRVAIGKALKAIGPLWVISYNILVVVSISSEKYQGLSELSFLRGIILKENLAGDKPVWDMKTILNGGEVPKLVGKTEPGPWMSSIMSQIFEWQLANPEKGKEECKLWLSANKDQLLS